MLQKLIGISALLRVSPLHATDRSRMHVRQRSQNFNENRQDISHSDLNAVTALQPLGSCPALVAGAILSTRGSRLRQALGYTNMQVGLVGAAHKKLLSEPAPQSLSLAAIAAVMRRPCPVSPINSILPSKVCIQGKFFVAWLLTSKLSACNPTCQNAMHASALVFMLSNMHKEALSQADQDDWRCAAVGPSLLSSHPSQAGPVNTDTSSARGKIL